MLDDAAGQATDAVAEDQLLTPTDASHGGGVEAFVAIHDGQLTAVGQRVDVEQAGQSAPGKGFTQPAEQSAVGGSRMRRSNLGHVTAAAALEFPQQFGVVVIESIRHHHLDVHMQVAACTRTQMRHPVTAAGRHRTGWVPAGW